MTEKKSKKYPSAHLYLNHELLNLIQKDVEAISEKSGIDLKKSQYVRMCFESGRETVLKKFHVL